MTRDRDAVRQGLDLAGQLLDQAARPLIGLLGPLRAHRASVVVDDLDIEAVLGLLEYHLRGQLVDLRQVLQRLAQRRGGQREAAILVEGTYVLTVAVAVVVARRGLAVLLHAGVLRLR